MPIDPSLSLTQWTAIGPQPIKMGQALNGRVDVSGRVTAIACSPGSTAFSCGPNRYLGAGIGGVWKSSDAGASWTPMTDFQESLAVGGLAVTPAPSPGDTACSPSTGTGDTIYVGTGEGDDNFDSEYGQGILKSTDGGMTWNQLAATTFDGLAFNRISVLNDNPDVLYAATSWGVIGGAAAECNPVLPFGTPLGIYKSTNCGQSWVLLSGQNGLPSQSVPSPPCLEDSGDDVRVDPAHDFVGPFSGVVEATNYPTCSDTATLTALSDPSNPLSTNNAFKLTASQQRTSGWFIRGRVFLRQSNFICGTDDFTDWYDCYGSVSDLRGSTASGFICGGETTSTELDIQNGQFGSKGGSPYGGSAEDGNFSGTIYMPPQGSGFDVMRQSVNLNAAPAVLAAVGGSGVFRSIDAGKHWTQVTAANGLPIGGSRFAMDGDPASYVWYLARADQQQKTLPDGSSVTQTRIEGVYSSVDSGMTWCRGAYTNTFPNPTCKAGFSLPQLTDPNYFGQEEDIFNENNQETFHLEVAVDPLADQTVYLSGIGLYASNYGSTDPGAYNFIGGGNHVDYHALKVDSGVLYTGNDGGLFSSTAASGWTWNSLNSSLQITQLQGIGLDPTGSIVTGGTQDNGTDLISPILSTLAWSHSDDGDGGFALIDPQNTAVFFAENDNIGSALTLERSSMSGAFGSYIAIAPTPIKGDTVQFYAPFTEDLSCPERLLLGTNRVWESCALNTSSPCLSCNGVSGSPPFWNDISGDLRNGCTSDDCSITDVAIAPGDSDVIYAVTGSDVSAGGSSGPYAWVSTNGTSSSPTWTQIAPPGINSVQFTSVAVSPTVPSTALITASGFTAAGGQGHHVFLVTNYGETWADISTSLPNIPALTAIFDAANPATSFFVGTDIGVFHTADGGTTWTNANLNSLPMVPVYQLREATGGGIIVAATHGRGAWALAEATPTPTATPTETATASATATETATPTITQTATITATATSTGTGTLTPTATGTSTVTPTGTPTATSTSSKTATATATRSVTPTPTKSTTPTATSTPKPKVKTVLKVTPHKLKYTTLNTPESLDLTLSASGGEVSGNVNPPHPFWLTSGTGAFDITPGNAATIGITFVPTAAGTIKSTTFVTSDAKFGRKVKVTLIGKAAGPVSTATPQAMTPTSTATTTPTATATP